MRSIVLSAMCTHWTADSTAGFRFPPFLQKQKQKKHLGQKVEREREREREREGEREGERERERERERDGGQRGRRRGEGERRLAVKKVANSKTVCKNSQIPKRKV